MALDQILLISLKALEPYLDDMVIAGGWVPYLFAAHEQPSAEAVATVALHGHGADGVLAAHARAGLVADAHEAAAAVDLEGGLLAVGGAQPGQR